MDFRAMVGQGGQTGTQGQTWLKVSGVRGYSPGKDFAAMLFRLT